MNDDLQNILIDLGSIAILEALPEESLPGLEAALDSKNAETIEAYLRAHIPDLEEVIRKKGESLRAPHS
ncbi:MAG: hypothetical protein WBK28_00400 [Minisyncoccia bacterium]